MRLATFLLNAGALLIAGAAAAASPAPTAPARTQACTLLSASEIEKTQAGHLATTRESQREMGALLISQCFYVLEPFASSVSLEVTASASGGYAARERWERVFHAAERERERESKGKEVDDEDAPPPQSVAGLGEEAYWIQGAASGVLYVLSGNLSLRLSVGGPEAPDAKAKKSRALAELALARLKTERASR